MYGLDNNSGVSVMPAIAPTSSATPLWFTEGGANQSPSYPGQDWFNQVQAELLNVLTEAGIAPDKADNTQLSRAISQIIAASANVIPVGIPLPWPTATATAPAGWLKCNGAAFDKAKYPALAVAYPSGSLPDLRGEFIRGTDDGRGMDAGRSVLSAQNDAMGVSYASNGLTVKNILVLTNRTGSGADAIDGLAAGDAFTDGGQTSSARLSVRSANETRPRNIAFNYIVRAA
ncbi:tail fiber protein [Erwinia tracheiphila]|uniref:Phage tail collar domain-containing protein n=2 Tax=Erwinia tracheiphila TaxID=65700 RepID=A0A0M2K9U5_9GAMM|nr:phage tail protein [Erwinia tracheiphila]EOS94152.1 putative bacteriophage tail fiber protein [Erwinia tracheiphila PSU-1]KKF35704.1 hypothetical protein SY86_10165 [Erwinia tracheiphila]KKF36648.1 hypothetical protein SY86_16295 [Erwinia tracheiphila]KKF37699.1 hypothetical protein SY86_23515 [Erwinia tracheiphila]UIA87986.1 tail fiber protein [Erwinia tracheiphila]